MKSATLVGALLIAAFLTALALIPKAFQSQSISIELNAVNPPKYSSFPMEANFTNIEVTRANVTRLEDRGTRRLRDFVADDGNLLVNFWATWCPPCIDELPSLEFLNRKLKAAARGPAVPVLVTVSVDERIEEIRSLYATLDFTPTFPLLLDRSGEFSRSVGTVKFPETYWIDSRGRIMHKWAGPQDWLSDKIIRRLARLSPAD